MPGVDGQLPTRLRPFEDLRRNFPMSEFRAYCSHRRTLLLLLAAIGFVAIGVWFSGIFGEVPTCPPSARCRFPPTLLPYIGWVAILFFGLVAIVSAERLRNPEAHLTIGLDGIFAARSYGDTIPWSQIESVSTWRDETIVLSLRSSHRLWSKGSARLFAYVTRRLTGGDIAVSLIGTNRSLSEAMPAISQFRP